MVDKGKTRSLRIEVEAFDVERDEEVPRLAAYAFGKSGKLLGRVDLDPQTGGTIALPPTGEPDEVRVLVGPGLRAEAPQLLSDLIRVGAAEKTVRPAGLTERVLVPLDRAVWHCWLRFCTVRGTLVKRESLGTTRVELPVCGAEIEIYEVDPLPVVIAQIPDHVLDILREKIRRPAPEPDPAPFLPVDPGPRPLPPPGPGPDSEHLEASAAADKSVRVFQFAGTDQLPVSREEVSAALQAVGAEPSLVRAATVGVPAFRAALLEYPKLARPLLCFLWPAAVKIQLIATATTDDCGHFRARFYRGCSSDVPDLYFRAYRRVGFWRFPILTPTPIACHTRWNYVCGTEVRLVTTSPFAQTCPPCQPVIAPDRWVLAMAVGNTSFARIGTNGLLDTGAPWGGMLNFRFEFDHTLRSDLNVRYYQVSWRKAGSANPYVALTATQVRHYIHQVGTAFPIDPYVLGPQGVGSTPNLFELPPALPPVSGAQWVVADAVVDTSSASFASASFAPPADSGLYEFKLDLFDAAGVRVDAAASGISFRVPTTTNLTGTIPTADAASLGLVNGGSLVFRLHIDNNRCAGSIGPAGLGGVTLGAECGVLEYGSTAAGLHMPFTASHPHGFATYSFVVVKGLTRVLTENGQVGSPPGTHVVSSTVSSLLGACTVSGFAEDLYVAATATDGWNRLASYDADPLPRPFVLTPED